MRAYWKAAGYSAALSTLFVVVYAGCNWITSLRPQVGSCYFAWERHIPFIPAMIIPYMSIDLFFVAAPFLTRSDRELRLFATRIAAAILIAGGCFLLLPLKFAFARPPVAGILGLIFNNFRSVDLPFNEFPSLHIALWAILADMYNRHTKGPLWWLVAFWFILIALSPLPTYQHHVIDIAGGVILAALCFHFLGPQSLRQPVTPNPRIACYYMGSAIVLSALALALAPWTYPLLWPAFSLALVAAGYFFVGPGIFRKEHGALPWTTWLLLGPVLAGQRLSLAYYARRCRPYDRLTDQLWIGRRLSAAEAQQASAAGVTAVLDLTGEFTEPRPFRDLAYLQLPILDLTAPTPSQIDQAVAFIRQHAGAGIVYLHCKIGYSRTAVIAGAYLLATGHVSTVADACAALRAARPSLIVRPEALAALEAWQSVASGRSAVSLNFPC